MPHKRKYVCWQPKHIERANVNARVLSHYNSKKLTNTPGACATEKHRCETELAIRAKQHFIAQKR
jgi:hypothetical protein